MKNFNMKLITEGNQLFDVELEDLGFTVIMRPYTVKESKGIMESQHRDNQSEVTKATLQSCFVDTKPHQRNFNILDLPIYDAEKVMIALFTQSMASSKLPVIYKCTNDIPDPANPEKTKKCDTKVRLMVDTNQNFIPILKEEDKLIPVNNNVTIKLRVPTLFEILDTNMDDTKQLFDLMVNCIGSVIVSDPDEVYTREDLIDENGGNQQLVEIFESLKQNAITEIINFINNVPRVMNIIKIKCPTCGHEEEIQLKGLMDFLV